MDDPETASSAGYMRGSYPYYITNYKVTRLHVHGYKVLTKTLGDKITSIKI